MANPQSVLYLVTDGVVFPLQNGVSMLRSPAKTPTKISKTPTKDKVTLPTLSSLMVNVPFFAPDQTLHKLNYTQTMWLNY